MAESKAEVNASTKANKENKTLLNSMPAIT